MCISLCFKVYVPVIKMMCRLRAYSLAPDIYNSERSHDWLLLTLLFLISTTVKAVMIDCYGHCGYDALPFHPFKLTPFSLLPRLPYVLRNLKFYICSFTLVSCFHHSFCIFHCGEDLYYLHMWHVCEHNTYPWTLRNYTEYDRARETYPIIISFSLYIYI